MGEDQEFRERVRAIVKEYDEEEIPEPKEAETMNKCAPILLMFYVIAGLATFAFIQNHADLSDHAKAPASFLGAVAWPVYWAGYGALAVDEVMTKASKPVPPICRSPTGEWPAREYSVGKFLCDTSDVPQKQGSTGSFMNGSVSVNASTYCGYVTTFGAGGAGTLTCWNRQPNGTWVQQ